MKANPVTDLNLMTARHRIRLVNGNPVEDSSPAYQILSMLSEDPGWAMEETPREGSLLSEFEETGQNTVTQFVAAVERRCEPLIAEQVIVSATCSNVRQVLTRDGSAFYFDLTYKTPGSTDEESLPMSIGN